MIQQPAKTPDCKVCLVAHDEELHEATLSLKRWYRSEVTKYFVYPEEGEAQEVVTAA